MVNWHFCVTLWWHQSVITKGFSYLYCLLLIFRSSYSWKDTRWYPQELYVQNDVSVSLLGIGNKDLKIDILSYVRHLMPQARCSASVTIRPNQRGMSDLSHELYFLQMCQHSKETVINIYIWESRIPPGLCVFLPLSLSEREMSRHHLDFISLHTCQLTALLISLP